MESTHIRQIKEVLWDQAFMGNTWVSCPMRLVGAIMKKEGTTSGSLAPSSHLVFHTVDHPAMPKPVGDKGMRGPDGESRLFTKGASFGLGGGVKSSCANPTSQPIAQPPEKVGQTPSDVFQEQVPSRHKQTMEVSERRNGIWHGIQGIGADNQLKPDALISHPSLSLAPNHALFEPQVGNPTETGLCLGQHILTAINPSQLGSGKPLVQEENQHSRPAGHIQQTRDTSVLLGLLGDGLDVHQCECC